MLVVAPSGRFHLSLTRWVFNSDGVVGIWEREEGDKEDLGTILLKRVLCIVLIQYTYI